jgi:hypothetical protein
MQADITEGNLIPVKSLKRWNLVNYCHGIKLTARERMLVYEKHGSLLQWTIPLFVQRRC